MINRVKRIIAAALLLIMVISLVPVSASAAQTFEGDDKIVVVIDPGHGGHDPGASKNGVTEDVWTLAVAKELKKLLEENGNFIVYLTRTSDTYLSVSERGIIANQKNADLLFSIHFDSNGSPNARGTTFITSIFDKYAIVDLGEKVMNELKNQVGLPKNKILRRADDAGYYWNEEMQWDCQDPSLGVLSDYYGIPTWGAKFGYKGVIVEHGFVSSKADTDIIKRAGAEGLAKADAKAIIDYYTNHTHTYQSAPTMDYPSNCTFVGKESVKCTTCGHRKNITNLEPAPDNHYWINEERKNATCGVDGYIYHECRITLNLEEKKVHNISYGDHKETINLKAEAHEYELVDLKKVSHAVDGYNKYKCKKCDHTYTETIKCEGHTWYVSKDVKPTCVKAGQIVRACRGCDETKTETVKALGHSVKFKIEKEPTCTEVGIKAGICSRCDAKETEEIKALGHDMKYAVETEPTCTEEGVEKGACTRCTETEEKAIEALGHNMVESARVEPTCEESGSVESKCDRCDHTESIVLEATGHKKGDDGVCETCGKVLETMPPETKEPEPQTAPIVTIGELSPSQGEEKKTNELLAIVLIIGAALLAVVFIVVRLIVAKKTTNNEDEAEAEEDEEEETTPAEEVPEETEV